MIDDGIKKAFDFASDTTKQLITLSSGIIAITVTFQKDVFRDVPSEAKILLYISWCLYLLSIVFGIGTMMALTGTLEKNSPNDKENLNIWKPDPLLTRIDDEDHTKLSIYSNNITKLSRLQVIQRSS